MLTNHTKSELELMVGRLEKILWKGKPNKRCFILESIFNPLFPFALIWLLFDAFFIYAFLHAAPTDEIPNEFAPTLIIFFAIHLMPVWLYLIGVFFVFKRYKHTEYIITDKAIYYSGGLFSSSCNMRPVTELAHVNINIHRGMIDQIIGVGDVIITSNNIDQLYRSRNISQVKPIIITIADTKEYRQVYEIIARLKEDISEKNNAS